MSDDGLLGNTDPIVRGPHGERRVSELVCADRAWTSLAPEHTYTFLPPHKCILCGARQDKENDDAR